MALRKKLEACEHSSHSLPGVFGTLLVCFYCGSTKRVGEIDWMAPWLWRKV